MVAPVAGPHPETGVPGDAPAPAAPVGGEAVTGVNDWSRVSVAWDRVFDDVASVSAELKQVFKDAYRSAQVDEGARRGRRDGVSATVSSLAADQFLGVSEHLDRGLAGAKAVMGAVGETLHEGGSERLHGEVEGAMKVSLYEMGMLLIRMSEKLDGDVPPYPPRPDRFPPPPAPPAPESRPEGGPCAPARESVQEVVREPVPDVVREPVPDVVPEVVPEPVLDLRDAPGPPLVVICPD